MKTVNVVAAIIKENNKILCAQRKEGLNPETSLKWEFPGGKIEENETPEEALKRELMEELNINVKVNSFFCSLEHDYPKFHLSMKLFNCEIISGEIKLNVHESIKWVNVNEIKSLDWLKADIKILDNIIKNKTE